MTEKEKMLLGEHYDSRDPELIEMYHRARDFLWRYNRLDSRLTEERMEILTDLLGQVGKGVWVEAPFYCDYGENITLGSDTFVHMNCMFLDNHRITIGSNGLVGPYVQIYTASHPLRAEERIIPTASGTRYLTSALPVTIGDNVWIGGNVVICPGVVIGDNVTVGAGSVVTKDIPDGAIVYGNPGRVEG